MTLMFTQNHRVLGNLQEAAKMFMGVDYVREVTVKKCCKADMDCFNVCSYFILFCCVVSSSFVFVSFTFCREPYIFVYLSFKTFWTFILLLLLFR